jgi:hypothetical protein
MAIVSGRRGLPTAQVGEDPLGLRLLAQVRLEVEGSDFSLKLLLCGQGVGDGLAPNGG